MRHLSQTGTEWVAPGDALDTQIRQVVTNHPKNRKTTDEADQDRAADRAAQLGRELEVGTRPKGRRPRNGGPFLFQRPKSFMPVNSRLRTQPSLAAARTAIATYPRLTKTLFRVPTRKSLIPRGRIGGRGLFRNHMVFTR